MSKRRPSRLPSSSHRQTWPNALLLSQAPHPYIMPEEMLLFEPTADHYHKVFFRGSSKEVRIRQIYNHAPLTEIEQKWFKEWRKKCSKERINCPPEAEAFLLRILLYNNRKFKEEYLAKTAAHLEIMSTWRQTMYPLMDSEPDILEDLNKGIMYWCARDSSLRPLLVIRLKRLPRNTPSERFKRLVVFCFEYALRCILLPGKAETCSVLLDVRGVSLSAFPASALTDMTTTLTKQYPFRLETMYIINDSIFIQTVWTVAKNFLSEIQQAKMNFYKSGFKDVLKSTYAKHQLEETFGGSRPDLSKFYPFVIPPGPYEPGSTPKSNPKPHCSEACDEVTQFGVCWEGEVKTPILWTAKGEQLFSDLGKKIEVPLREPVGKKRLNTIASNKSFVEAKVSSEPSSPRQQTTPEPPNENILPSERPGDLTNRQTSGLVIAASMEKSMTEETFEEMGSFNNVEVMSEVVSQKSMPENQPAAVDQVTDSSQAKMDLPHGAIQAHAVSVTEASQSEGSEYKNRESMVPTKGASPSSNSSRSQYDSSSLSAPSTASRKKKSHTPKTSRSEDCCGACLPCRQS